MLGMDHSQRSNAVGANSSYLPSGDIGRDGGGTYTGQATEPTVQDYENFFGPSARDIKTDLQRFKRHGRWHLPDVLKGPNPWLTDRIDGLISDATNSPFTTKILPYRYKEDVDGKMKWNVWSFDEGMASRVPYEAAARTLTQSKRSFAGYMVRQGMAIVLEHNFMMTPQGRENFKNQLNQLIGSIQYTNDLDVHMALILAPSYQKTLQEKYYTSDKAPSQLCREYADLFGMMQKNVNALDILIEEGKAILKTWGGPMPDFLLCNSKLTFQMTMTPEKTNYITQGIDGVKRLRQGPDLGSYRGLSVIHSRSFSMETGQHPRDVLRRRVRTAEYYRIPPNARNMHREFEFYNEERDTWFTLSFADLLRCARYISDGNDENAHRIDALCNYLSDQERRGANNNILNAGLHQALGAPAFALGAYAKADSGNAAGLDALLGAIRARCAQILVDPVMDSKFALDMCDVRPGQVESWYNSGLSTDVGVTFKDPEDNDVWGEFQAILRDNGLANVPIAQHMLNIAPLTKGMDSRLFSACKQKGLNDVLYLRNGNQISPGTPEWYVTYLYHLECIKRKALSKEFLDVPAANTNLDQLVLKADYRSVQNASLENQLLSLIGAAGSVNHPLHLTRTATNMPNVPPGDLASLNDALHNNSFGSYVGRSILLTYEWLQWLLGPVPNEHHRYRINQLCEEPTPEAIALFRFASTNLRGPLCTYSARIAGQVLQIDESKANAEELCRLGLSTVPMYFTTSSHLFHPDMTLDQQIRKSIFQLCKSTSGYLNRTALQEFDRIANGINHPWGYDTLLGGGAPGPDNARVDAINFFKTLKTRLFDDPIRAVSGELQAVGNGIHRLGSAELDRASFFRVRESASRVRSISSSPLNLVIDLNKFFDQRGEDHPDGVVPGTGGGAELAGNVEVVVVRPNIEHNMLGIIMGLGGDQLGNTLWGQTELSVYDDSMHGIWGMSYKYHERAIVFNEKNLIRLWDIAYDGYNGGKDDTYVDWTNGNSVDSFKEATMNLGKNYRGQSMMVLAFAHDRNQVNDRGVNLYEAQFKRNWPSPVVFYDSYNPERRQDSGREALPLDYDNLQTVDVEEFRVFNNELYNGSYRQYRNLMPDFRTLHMTRKSAGQSSADAETGTDCLAFQGSMRVKERGQLLQDIQGSGHHGPDYVGIASVRAGKGQKMAGQAPTLHRLI